MKSKRMTLDWAIIILGVLSIVGLFIPLLRTYTGTTSVAHYIWNMFTLNNVVAVTVACLAILTVLTNIGLMILAIDDLYFRSITVKNMSIILAIMAIGLAMLTFILSFVAGAQLSVVGARVLPCVGMYMLSITTLLSSAAAITNSVMTIPSKTSRM